MKLGTEARRGSHCFFLHQPPIFFFFLLQFLGGLCGALMEAAKGWRGSNPPTPPLPPPMSKDELLLDCYFIWEKPTALHWALSSTGRAIRPCVITVFIVAGHLPTVGPHRRARLHPPHLLRPLIRPFTPSHPTPPRG